MQAYCEPTLRSVSPGNESTSMDALFDLGLIHATIAQPIPRTHEAATSVPRWRAVVWDDPVNLMSYVTAVFREYFGYSTARAEELMLAVHTRGRAIVSTGVRERIEADVMAMHSYGLRATIEEDRD